MLIVCMKYHLTQFLNLKSSFGIAIPKYAILYKNNIIINKNASKPSHKDFESIKKKHQLAKL